MSRQRLLSSLGLALALLAGPLVVSRAAANPVVLFEPATGQVLLAEDPDKVWFPASLTKLMTAYLAFDAVKSGRLTWDSKVQFSEKARAQPATRIGLRAGIEVTLDKAVRGLIMRSANDFAMALAETIAGSEEAFAKLMNDTATRLGMKRTVFRNPHGLPDPEQVTTARDMAILTRALLHDFPEQAEVFSTQHVVIHRGTFHSENGLLRTLEGGDGMKTGFTCGAGYNIVGSATRDGHRVVAVVLGAGTKEARAKQVAALIEKGFAHHSGTEPLPALGDLAKLPVSPAEAAIPDDLKRTARTSKCASYGPVARDPGEKDAPKVARPAKPKRRSAIDTAEGSTPGKDEFPRAQRIAKSRPKPAEPLKASVVQP